MAGHGHNCLLSEGGLQPGRAREAPYSSLERGIHFGLARAQEVTRHRWAGAVGPVAGCPGPMGWMCVLRRRLPPEQARRVPWSRCQPAPQNVLCAKISVLRSTGETMTQLCQNVLTGLCRREACPLELRRGGAVARGRKRRSAMRSHPKGGKPRPPRPARPAREPPERLSDQQGRPI